MTPVDEIEGGCRIRVRAQPRASRTELAGLHGDALKIRVAAPPVDGAANEAILELLAKSLGVPTGAVRLARGSSSRTKTIEVRGVDAATATARLGLG
ncbi:MAG: DUF167 domain-containing protein [Gemmatimonadales bacterium]